MKDELKIIGLTESQIQAAALHAAKNVKNCGWPDAVKHDKFMYRFGLEAARMAIHSNTLNRLLYDNVEVTHE